MERVEPKTNRFIVKCESCEFTRTIPYEIGDLDDFEDKMRMAEDFASLHSNTELNGFGLRGRMDRHFVNVSIERT